MLNSSRLGPLTLLLSASFVLLPACHRAPSPEPTPPAGNPQPQVAPSTDLRGASDHADAPPAIGAMTAGQASGGARGGAMPPTAGDGAASAPASAASR